MKKKLQKILNAHGYDLVSCRYGIYGDWYVSREGFQHRMYFPTLGSVRKFVESL